MKVRSTGSGNSDLVSLQLEGSVCFASSSEFEVCGVFVGDTSSVICLNLRQKGV